MFRRNPKPLVSCLIACILVATPFLIVHGSGARIEGKVTDPKGAAVVGAVVAVTDEISGRRFEAVSDQQGRYKVEGLPAGTYNVVVTAKGFSEGGRESVFVQEGGVVPLDIRLELAPIEESVTVAKSLKANSDSVYQQLRQQGKPPQDLAGDFATVNNLILKRESTVFELRSGEIYFLPPIEGRTTSAVFIGDGEMTLTPPTEAERNHLKIFVDQPTLTEAFSTLVLRFTDKTFEEVKASPNAKLSTGGRQAGRARDLFRDNQQLLRKRLRRNRELRILADLYAPERPGFFHAFIEGRRFNKLVYLHDPLGIPEVSPEEVLLMSYGETDGGFWNAFHEVDEYRAGTANSAEDSRIVDILHHEIDASIKGSNLAATDVVTVRTLKKTRVVPFRLFPTLRVSRVQDGEGNEIDFVQENKDEDADFAVILPQPLESGKAYKFSVSYEGNDALRDSGGGNFILVPGARSSWYPNTAGTQFGDRAIFNVTFRYPKNMMFVGTGAPLAAETREGDLNVAQWSSGSTELAVAGFNYGRFKKKELADQDTGYNIEFYANEEVPDELKRVQLAIERAEREGFNTGTTLGVISTTKIADAAIADAQNATRIYNAYFGKLPYTRLAMTQQPAVGFGQAWPTLVFMPYTAFIDTTQRTQLFGVRGGTDNFWRYVAPHEVAHQWWGHIIGWNSYRDQWMSEGFAEFSTSLYVWYVRKDMKKFIDFWEEQRDQIIQSTPFTRDRKPYTIGPVTQGYRLNSAKTGGVARNLIYPKGAYILHMLRMMMFEHGKGDARFQEMMKDFVQTHFNKDVSTEDFKRIVEKHMTDNMRFKGSEGMDWFFHQWVYGTEIPSYRFEYKIASDGSLSGKLTQSGVSDTFAMPVPVYVDFGKGWSKLGMARVVGNNSVELKDIKLPAVPKRAAICAFQDVLALSIENVK